MPMKLSAVQKKKLSAIQSDLETAWQHLEDETAQANELIRPILEKLLKERKEYVLKVEEGAAYLEGIADDLRSEWDEKSERWQEGDAGSSAAAWIDELSSHAGNISVEFEDDDLSEFEIRMPDDVSSEFDTENVPTEPD